MDNKGKLGVVAVLVLAVGAVLAVKHWDRTAPVETPNPGESASKPAEPGEPMPTLIDLGKGKCDQCKRMIPVLEGLEHDYAGRLAVETIDLRTNPAASEFYQVKLIPLQVFLAPDGMEIYRHEGFMSRQEILAKWKELGHDLDATPAAKKGNAS